MESPSAVPQRNDLSVGQGTILAHPPPIRPSGGAPRRASLPGGPVAPRGRHVRATARPSRDPDRRGLTPIRRRRTRVDDWRRCLACLLRTVTSKYWPAFAASPRRRIYCRIHAGTGKPATGEGEQSCSDTMRRQASRPTTAPTHGVGPGRECARRRARERADAESISELRWQWRCACSNTSLAPMIYTPSGATRGVPIIAHVDWGRRSASWCERGRARAAAISPPQRLR